MNGALSDGANGKDELFGGKGRCWEGIAIDGGEGLGGSDGVVIIGWIVVSAGGLERGVDGLGEEVHGLLKGIDTEGRPVGGEEEEEGVAWVKILRSEWVA